MTVLDGVLEVGDIVWEQMYEPTSPSWQATLAERIAGGVTYGRRRMMRVTYIHRDGIDGPCPYADAAGLHPLSGKPLPAHTEHYGLVDPTDKSEYSNTDNNWCVLEHVHDEGALW